MQSSNLCNVREGVPLKELSRVSHFTHSVNVHVNTRAKGNPMKAVREGSIIFRFD